MEEAAQTDVASSKAETTDHNTLPPTTAVTNTVPSILKTSNTSSVSVPDTGSKSPFIFPTQANPVLVPFQNPLQENPIPMPAYFVMMPERSTPYKTSGSFSLPRTFPSLPVTSISSNLPPPVVHPQGVTISEPQPLKPPKENSAPDPPVAYKRHLTTTPQFTPMSVGVRETEWLQLTQLGLGKALDATNPHPWASKSSYQAKEVKVCDLVLTDEGQRLINYLKVIDNYFNVLCNLEGSIRLPHQPIEIGVAADTHRSYSQTQEIRGKTISTRTVTFNLTTDTHSKTDPNNCMTLFEYQLKCHLDREYEKMGEKERAHVSKMGLCLDFLHSLGGITHYISSITLGAMEYSVKKVQAIDIGCTVNSRAGFGPLAGAMASKTLSMTKSKRKQLQHVEKIGRISDNECVTPHTHDEAVINYSITSLANLITEPILRLDVQKAIQTYITTRLHKINGPYYIMTPERVQEGKNIYWMVAEERHRGVVTHYVRPTLNKEEASIFFIRPDYRKVGKYFFITTCEPTATSDENRASQIPEEASGQEPTSVLGSSPQQRDQLECSLASSTHQPSTSLNFTDSGEQTATSKKRSIDEHRGDVRHCLSKMMHSCIPGYNYHGIDHRGNASQLVERYVHVGRRSFYKHLPRSTRITMKAKAAVRPEFARFQLVDRRDRTAKTLLESDWLPDECESSGQPFFLRQYYHLTNCVGVRGITEPWLIDHGLHFSLCNKSCHREGRCHMLFQLIRAEKPIDGDTKT